MYRSRGANRQLASFFWITSMFFLLGQILIKWISSCYKCTLLVVYVGKNPFIYIPRLSNPVGCQRSKVEVFTIFCMVIC